MYGLTTDTTSTVLGSTGTLNNGGVHAEAYIIFAIFVIMTVIGVIGNSIVIFVILKSGKGKVSTTTNCYIMSLAVTDISFLICCALPTAIIYIQPFGKWIFGPFLCRFVFFAMHVSSQATCLTLVGMSVDRYQAIVRPLKSLSTRTIKIASVVVLSIWSFSVVTAVPVFIFFQEIPHPNYPGSDLIVCSEKWPLEYMYPGYAVYGFIMFYFVPLLVISVCYTFVILKLWQQTLPGVDGLHFHHRAREVRQRRRVTWMVLTVIIAFAVCWLPIHCVNLWQRLDPFFPMTYRVFRIKVTTHTLAYSNSCYNPFFYAFMGGNFRKYFRKAFPFCFRSHAVGQAPNTRRTDGGSSVEEQQQMANFKGGSSVVTGRTVTSHFRASEYKNND